MARALVYVPRNPKRGEVIEIRVTIAHPMETGYRPDAAGRALPRDIVTHFSCHFEGRPGFTAQLYPAIAANPYLAFPWRVAGSGTLTFRWDGDNGFSQTETAQVQAA